MFALSARLSIRALNTLPKPVHIERGLRSTTRQFSSQPLNFSNLQVGDRILLRWKAGKTSKSKITKPLREDGETNLDNFIVNHKDILDQPSNFRFTKLSKDGTRKLSVTARHPTLDEFTSQAPRRVAPIYGTYASTIVDLLDIHAEPPSPDNDPSVADGPSLQILEAGTGHGSLTLYLSRAIAASNPLITPEIKPTPSKKRIYRAGEESDDDVGLSESDAFVSWRAQRRSVIHTIEIDALNSKHAEQLIRSYRNAVYWPHIDFHVGNVKDWVSERLEQQDNTPFLDAALLDMPGVEDHIASTLPAIKEGGVLLVFVPQITQIATCVQEIVTKDLGLKLERVVELGDGISTGRLWDVRMATLRNSRTSKPMKKEQNTETTAAESPSELPSPAVGTIPPMVCRPIVGEMTRGGGFIGLWKKVGSVGSVTAAD